MDSKNARLQEGATEENGLSKNDVLFLIGLGLFIVFLSLAHPSTPEIAHQTLMFYTSVTALFLSMAPDYINRETAEEWLKEYRDTRLEGLYRRIHGIARKGDRYFGSTTFFLIGSVFVIAGVFALSRTGEVYESLYGLGWGALLRSIIH